ncbi:hypothetical protein IscW_ISCW006973 [Ixodes scapularis]|uniref:Secreted protein n=1 Tax=Ixodes scapularis TaxID=6945 RepID=B7PU40_IXOSC|nr:hypothetical protein IscW_ISCW006973 [Ixodes scapularis]|eukprot:XP_002405386.1 hypothetical protein IscW_ISCW006973 [Ixodes scapularis]
MELFLRLAWIVIYLWPMLAVGNPLDCPFWKDILEAPGFLQLSLLPPEMLAWTSVYPKGLLGCRQLYAG